MDYYWLSSHGDTIVPIVTWSHHFKPTTRGEIYVEDRRHDDGIMRRHGNWRGWGESELGLWEEAWQLEERRLVWAGALRGGMATGGKEASLSWSSERRPGNWRRGGESELELWEEAWQLEEGGGESELELWEEAWQLEERRRVWAGALRGGLATGGEEASLSWSSERRPGNWRGGGESELELWEEAWQLEGRRRVWAGALRGGLATGGEEASLSWSSERRHGNWREEASLSWSSERRPGNWRRGGESELELWEEAWQLEGRRRVWAGALRGGLATGGEEASLSWSSERRHGNWRKGGESELELWEEAWQLEERRRVWAGALRGGLATGGEEASLSWSSERRPGNWRGGGESELELWEEAWQLEERRRVSWSSERRPGNWRRGGESELELWEEAWQLEERRRVWAGALRGGLATGGKEASLSWSSERRHGNWRRGGESELELWEEAWQLEGRRRVWAGALRQAMIPALPVVGGGSILITWTWLTRHTHIMSYHVQPSSACHPVLRPPQIWVPGAGQDKNYMGHGKTRCHCHTRPWTCGYRIATIL